jgi:hypothetical protein
LYAGAKVAVKAAGEVKARKEEMEEAKVCAFLI